MCSVYPILSVLLQNQNQAALPILKYYNKKIGKQSMTRSFERSLREISSIMYINLSHVFWFYNKELDSNFQVSKFYHKGPVNMCSFNINLGKVCTWNWIISLSEQLITFKFFVKSFLKWFISVCVKGTC